MLHHSTFLANISYIHDFECLSCLTLPERIPQIWQCCEGLKIYVSNHTENILDLKIKVNTIQYFIYTNASIFVNIQFFNDYIKLVLLFFKNLIT